MRRLITLVTVALAVAILAGCAATVCKDLSGFPKATCEVKEVVSIVETNVPPALAALEAARPMFTPDVQARIDLVLTAWPPLRASMDSLVAGMEAGQVGDVATVIASALDLYTRVSELVRLLDGKPLPPLPATATVNAMGP